MHVLIANDDGIHAPGIQALAVHLAASAKVTVVAPDRQQSATSHAITLHKPLYVSEVDLGDNITAYQINGTPADCVKLALGALCSDSPPDIVLSGINSGPNLGLDVVYSGTVAAAAEAALHGVPAMAVSLIGAPFEFSASVLVVGKLLRLIESHGLMPGTFLNVNVPPGSYEDLKGIRITKSGIRKYYNAYEKRTDPLGRHYYWQAGEVVKVQNKPDTDVHAVERGLVSVTPVHFDFTNSLLLATLNAWQLSL